MNCNKVLIHDSARPNPSIKLIKRIIYSLKKNDAVMPVIKINDATKISKKNIVFGNLNRDNLKLAQTPQGFTFEKLYQKHYENINEAFDDDSALFIKDNEKIFTVNGDKNMQAFLAWESMENPELVDEDYMLKYFPELVSLMVAMYQDL